MEEQIKALLIDVDDCMLPTDGQVSLEFFAGLQIVSQYIKRANRGEFPPIGWCTGRDRNYIESFSFSVGLPDSWSIIESGVDLFNPTTKGLEHNPALTPKIEEAFEEISRKRIPQILERYPNLFPYPGNRIQVTLERQHGSDLSIQDAYETVREELSDLISAGLVIVHHSQIAVDISPAGIDKASGVRFFAEKTGLHPDQILGIGDSRGDFPFLQLVRYVGCPSNASSECKELVKERGGYISPHGYAMGVMDVIRHFIKED